MTDLGGRIRGALGEPVAYLRGDPRVSLVLLLLAGTVLLGAQAVRTCRRAADEAPLPDADPGE